MPPRRALPTLCLLLLLLLGLASLESVSAGTYRKPPFNGSIFGKRAGGYADDEGSRLAAVCRVALETCGTWYPGQQED